MTATGVIELFSFLFLRKSKII